MEHVLSGEISFERTKITLAVLLFSLLTAAGAFARIPLTPVPVTMQVFFVLLSGLVLGPVYGPASQIAYIVAGLAGAPFFAAFPHSGPAVLLGPTGGYLMGFVLASWIAGYLSLREPPGKKSILRMIAGVFAGIAVIYCSGTSWLACWLKLNHMSPLKAFELGVRPFVVVDVLKGIFAVAFAGFFNFRISRQRASLTSWRGF